MSIGLPELTGGSGRSELPRCIMNTPLTVGIIIPYFQKQPGLLRRAVQSILDQDALIRSGIGVLISIVDDGSPSAAMEDIQGLPVPEKVTVMIHKQANAGPGVARNTGLDLIEQRCDAIAFLDSDDTWTPEHLGNALLAMDAGADFYFSDVSRFFEQASLFSELPEWFSPLLEPIDAGRKLFFLQDKKDLAILKGLTVTSSVVYRVDRAERHRFPVDFFRFGEDQFFFLTVIEGNKKVAFSRNIEVDYGRGVNIFSGNPPRSLERLRCLQDEVKFRKLALGLPQLSREGRDHVRYKLKEARTILASEGLWLARSGDMTWIRSCLSRDPALIFETIKCFLGMFAKKIVSP